MRCCLTTSNLGIDAAFDAAVGLIKRKIATRGAGHPHLNFHWQGPRAHPAATRPYSTFTAKRGLSGAALRADFPLALILTSRCFSAGHGPAGAAFPFIT